jgi:hypothetical protein
MWSIYLCEITYTFVVTSPYQFGISPLSFPLNYGQDDKFYSRLVFLTRMEVYYFIFTFVMTVFIRTFLFSSAGTPNAASIIISKGSSECSFNKHTAGNIEAIYNLADTFK